MNKDINTESFLAIKNSLEIHSEEEDSLTEEDMIIQIERRVATMMERDMDLLMSYLYRLDILEHKINACLSPESPFHPYTCLATLIWNRQKDRVISKKQYKQDKTVEEGWEW